jgi:hypothetical protein
VALVTALAAVFAARNRRELSQPFRVLVVLGVVSVALMLPFSAILWRWTPDLRFVQFPWRWMEILCVGFAFFTAAAMNGSRGRRWASWIVVVFVFAALTAAASAMVRDAWWDSGDVPAMAEAIRSGRGYEGANEYAPVGSDRYELPGDPDDTERAEGVSSVPAERIAKFDMETGNVVPAVGVRLHVDRWSAERREFEADAAPPVTLAVRLVNFPAWELRVDDREIQTAAAPDTGQMLVTLPPGAHRVVIRFRRTWDRTTGGAISILSAISLLAFARRRRTPLV